MEGKPNADQNLISAFRQGDENAFRQVYSLYYRQVYYFARKITNSAEDAKDIVSETFMKLWTGSSNFATLSNIKAFLFITARNACINRLKTEQRQRRNENWYNRHTGNDFTGMFDLMAQHELLEEIQKELDKLSQQEKNIIELFYLEGITIKQIAERLNIEYEAAKKSKFRALARVRARLREKNLLSVLLMMGI